MVGRSLRYHAGPRPLIGIISPIHFWVGCAGEPHANTLPRHRSRSQPGRFRPNADLRRFSSDPRSNIARRIPRHQWTIFRLGKAC